MAMIFGKRSFKGILFHSLHIYVYNVLAFPGLMSMLFRTFSGFIGGTVGF